MRKLIIVAAFSLVVLLAGVVEAVQEVEQVVGELQQIVDNNPGTSVADKAEDALDKAQTALDELAKTPPDYHAALGNMEGAVGDLEAAVKDGLLDAAHGTELMNLLNCAAWQLGVGALYQAMGYDADADKITDVEQALAEGEQLWLDEVYKDAAAMYKDAVAKAEGALSGPIDPLAGLVTQTLVSEDDQEVGKALLCYDENENETRIRLKCWNHAANVEHTGLLCEVDDDGNVTDFIELGSFTTNENGNGCLGVRVSADVSDWNVVIGSFTSDGHIQLDAGPADCTIDSVVDELQVIVVLC